MTQTKRFSALGTLLVALGFAMALMLGQPALIEAQSGSSLLIDAAAAPLTAAPNNAERVSLYVTVQSSAGLIGGLESSSFIAFAEQLATGACQVSIIQLRTDNQRPGVYRLDLVPAAAGCTWKRGTYVLSVSVRQGSSTGGALTSFTLE